MGKYTIGLDFGTLSGRAVLVDVTTGEELATEVMDYPHAVMDQQLPDGTALGVDWALEHPQDYLDVLGYIIPGVLQKSGVNPADVIGVGVDFTTCTLIPCKADGTPMCFLPGNESRPHAYPKLWKHHAAQDQANRVTAVAKARGEKFLARYGGKISSEWAVPKMWQVLEEDPEMFDSIDVFVEACDWIIWQMTGSLRRNACMAGYKALWHKRDGFPGKDFFRALDPRLENVIEEKFWGEVVSVGERSGEMSEAGAARTGLLPGTAVAVGGSDAHVAPCAVGVTTPGNVVAIIGTSTCHMMLGDEEYEVPGMCGVVEDGVVPGYFGYEAGQSCCGDHFAWFTKNCVPAAYEQAAADAGMSIHKYLREKAAAQKPGESGLVALDWWNGNRSVLVDVDLTGMILGMTLTTRPEEIYRALLEATAYGTRKIIEAFTTAGLPANVFYASGGIAQKDPLMMQIYADVLHMPIHVAGTLQAPALGSAILAAVAAGSERGGYDSLTEAGAHMGKPGNIVYEPIEENCAVYDALYREYEQLHDYFGRGANDVMKRLKEIKRGTRA